jgi:hypothetical protein
MQTDLMHDVGDVGPCEGQVLESPCNAPKLRSVLNRRPRVCSELRLEVDWSRTQLTISYGRMFDDVQRVSALVKKHPIWTALDSNAEEVVKRPKVHHKFPMYTKNSAAQKRRVIGCQNYIINVEQQVYCVNAPTEDEQRGIHLGLNKPQGEQIGGEPDVPCSGRLL